MQINQRDKDQTIPTQLLVSLSQILKLYNKYLLFSLRQDLSADRKAGLVENIRERIRGISQKYGKLEISKQNKLVQRFLNRLNEKIKSCVDEYPCREIPIFLLQNLEAMQEINSNFKLSQLLISLFGLTRQERKQIRSQQKSIKQSNQEKEKQTSNNVSTANTIQRKASAYSTIEKKPKKVEVSPYKTIERTQRIQKIAIFKNFVKKPQQIQQNIIVISILQIDEKQYRRKYFTASQFLNQMQAQQFELKKKSNKNMSEIILNQEQNPVYAEQVQRNKGIKEMMEAYEDKYNKYKIKEEIKQRKQRQKQKQQILQLQRMKHKQRLSAPCFEKLVQNSVGEQIYQQQQKSPKSPTKSTTNKLFSILNRNKTKKNSYKMLNFKSDSIIKQESLQRQVSNNNNSLPQLKFPHPSNNNTNNSSGSNFVSILFNSSQTPNPIINKSRRDMLIKIQKIQQIITKSQKNYKGHKYKSYSTSKLNDQYNIKPYAQTQINIQITNNYNDSQTGSYAYNYVNNKYGNNKHIRNRNYGSSIIYNKQQFDRIINKAKSQNSHHFQNSNGENGSESNSNEMRNPFPVNKIQLISVHKIGEACADQRNNQNLNNSGINQQPPIIDPNTFATTINNKRLTKKYSMLYKQMEEKRIKLQSSYSRAKPLQILNKIHQEQSNSFEGQEQQKQIFLIACKGYNQKNHNKINHPAFTNLNEIKNIDIGKKQQIIHTNHSNY